MISFKLLNIGTYIQYMTKMKICEYYINKVCIFAVYKYRKNIRKTYYCINKFNNSKNEINKEKI